MKIVLSNNRSIIERLSEFHYRSFVMHLSMLSRWGGGGGGVGMGGGFNVTSLPVVGTSDHSLKSFDEQQCPWSEEFALF